MKSINQTTHDIIFIDKKVKKKLREEKENISDLEKKKKKLIRKLKQTKGYRDRLNINNDICDIEIYIRDVLDDFHISMYITRTMHIINQYNDLLEKVVEKDFVSGVTKNPDCAKLNKTKKEDLVDEYLLIASEYIDIKPIQVNIKKIKKNCTLCDSSDELVENTDYTTVCYNCGNEIKMIKNNPTYKDIDRVNITNKYKYDRISHFKDIMNKYQAKQTNTINDQVFSYINEQLESHGLLVNSPISSVKYSKVNKSHISMFLKEGGFSENYDDCVLIYCSITNTKPPNISHIEQSIMEDFEKLIKTYNSMKSTSDSFVGTKKRKNFLNSQYVLYQLLRRHKYRCKKEDFNILKTRDRRIEHDEVYMKLCDELKWTFISTI